MDRRAGASGQISASGPLLRRIREHPDGALYLHCVRHQCAGARLVCEASLFERICANDQSMRVRREQMQRRISCQARTDAFSTTQNLLHGFPAFLSRASFGTNHLPNARAGGNGGMKNRGATGVRRDDLLIAAAQGGTEVLRDASRGDP